MAFSKIAGLDVTPRSESPRTSRSSSPLSIRLRRIWSSQTLVPAAVSAASRWFTPAPTLIAVLLSGAGGYALHDGPGSLGDVVRGEAEVLVQVRLGGRLAEGRHRDRLAFVTHPGAPAERRGGLDRHARADAPRQHALAIVLVLLGEAVQARRRHHARGDAVPLELLGGLRADVELRARPDQDQVRVAVRRVAQ